MGELTLVRPAPAHAGQVMAFRTELLRNGDSFDGCAGLEEVETYEKWLDFEGRMREKGYVPAEVYLAVRRSDGLLAGIGDYRHPLSEFLLQYGGNIGYSIRPSLRRRGYASELLGLLLGACRAAGEERVLVTCDKENEASRRVIRKNGGVLENEVADTPALGRSGVIQRYWITL